MKRSINLKTALATTLLALPLQAIGQEPVASPSFVDIDNLFIYSYSYSPGSLNERGPIGKVYLSVISDEIFIKKEADVNQQKIEDAVLSLIPSAQISWVKDDVCTVIGNKQSIEANVNALLDNDDIISVRPAYIRRVYKDFMELYPVEQVKIYGFTDDIYVAQEYENDDEVDALMASLGVQFQSEPYGMLRQLRVFVPKESDIIAIANSLYETGFFSDSQPMLYGTVRNLDSEPLDRSGLDFVYDSNGEKVYLYKSPGQFMITKDKETDKADIEAIINKYLTDPYYVWVANNRCQIETDESLVDDAIANIRKEELVVSANRSYLKQSDYEWTLQNGTDYPSLFNFNQEILVSLKDDVSQSVKDSLLNAFDLTVIKEREMYDKWAALKTDDVIIVSQKLYESGYFKGVELDWITGYKIHQAFGSGTTGIKRPEIKETANIVSESYYDLLGRRMDTPSGMTIVVIRYSNGTVRTEKKLLKGEN